MDEWKWQYTNMHSTVLCIEFTTIRHSDAISIIINIILGASAFISTEICPFFNGEK